MLSIVALLMMAILAIGVLAFLGGLACMIIFIVRKCTRGAGGVGLLVAAISLMAGGFLLAMIPLIIPLLIPSFAG